MPETLPTFSDLASDYAIPRAILGSQIMPAMASTSRSTLRQQPCQRVEIPQQQPQPSPSPSPSPSSIMHNPSLRHPVFFTENLQRRRSFGQTAIQPTLLPAALPAQHLTNISLQPCNTQRASFEPLAAPAPPTSHASSPVAHGYCYRESPGRPIRQRPRPMGIGTGSKL